MPDTYQCTHCGKRYVVPSLASACKCGTREQPRDMRSQPSTG